VKIGALGEGSGVSSAAAAVGPAGTITFGWQAVRRRIVRTTMKLEHIFRIIYPLCVYNSIVNRKGNTDNGQYLSG
jgi:hypothetical protein